MSEILELIDDFRLNQQIQERKPAYIDVCTYRLKELVRQGKNIVCPHELLKRNDSELIKLIETEHYTLILDEVMDVISDIDMSPDDIITKF